MNSKAAAGVLFLLVWLYGQPPYAAPPPSGNSPQAAETVATDLQVGQRYEAGTRVRVAMKGISFVIPRDWSGGMAQGAGTIRLTSTTKPGIGLIDLFANINPQELAARLEESKELPGGVTLQLAAPVRTIGSRTMAFYREGELAGRALAIAGPSQNAVIYLFAGPGNQGAYYERLLEELAASTRLTNIKPDDLRKLWHDLVDGMMLTRLSSFSAGEAGGGSSSSVWHLCPNGGFVHLRSPGGVETSDPSASGDESRQGTGSWRVEMRGTDALLVLTTANGTQTVHSLEYDGTKLYLDEAQVSRAPSKRCVEGLNR